MAGVQIDGVNNKIDFDDDLDTSISANTDDTLVIEAGGNTMATITATTFTINDGTTITTADNTDTLTLTSTDADALVGPNLNFYRNSSSPADGDLMGQIKFTGESAGSGIHTYGSIVCENNGITDGQEQGKIKFNISMPDGALANVFNIDRTEVIINEDSEDLDFRVESNGNTHQFFVDAGTDNTMIGTSVNIDRWFNSAPGHSTIFQTSGFNDANRVNAFTHHSNDSGGAMIMLGKSRGGAVGYTVVGENDGIGQISFQAADGTDMVEAAKILGAVDGAPGANDIPGRLVFFTTADGAAASTERFRIANNGDLTATDTSIGSNSDSRLKENIADYTYDISKFKQFEAKTFDWKNSGEHNGKTGNRGFIAQEVAAIDDYWTDQISIDPDTEDAKLITADSDGKHNAYTLKLGKKDAMYISVIQQLITRIEALEG